MKYLPHILQHIENPFMKLPQPPALPEPEPEPAPPAPAQLQPPGVIIDLLRVLAANKAAESDPIAELMLYAPKPDPVPYARGFDPHAFMDRIEPPGLPLFLQRKA